MRSWYYYLHFTKRETETQIQLTHPRSWSGADVDSHAADPVFLTTALRLMKLFMENLPCL